MGLKTAGLLRVVGVVGVGWDGGDEKLLTASHLLIKTLTKKPADVGASAGFDCSQ